MRLEIINGQKIYGKRPILNQLNLVFQSGKIYGLKGDNGSGKTVLLKILAGYIKLDKGKVLQDGKVYGIKNHLNALDEKSVRLTKQVILSYLKKENGLVILTSHISEDISDLCTDVLVVENGHIQYVKDIQS